MIAVAPLPIYAHLAPCSLVVYNGAAEPISVFATPEDMFFIWRGPRPSACVWMVPRRDFGSIPS